MSTNYNKFCEARNCPEFIELNFEQGTDCFSCKKIGQSYDIEKYPDDCNFIDEIKLIQLDDKT